MPEYNGHSYKLGEITHSDSTALLKLMSLAR